jgi:CRP-like cAMP-binding protein
VSGLEAGNSACLSAFRELFATAKLVRLAGGDVLFRAGAADHGCYRLEDGLLKVAMVSGIGAERILAILGRGDIVGELAQPGRLRRLPRKTSRGLQIAGQAACSTPARNRHGSGNG